MGGRVRGEVETDGAKAIRAGGSIIHEVGGAIMGADPKTSVTDRWCQTWDVNNLFITDGAVVRVQRRQEPDADDHGAGLAHLRPHPGAYAQQGALMDRRTSLKWMLSAAARCR